MRFGKKTVPKLLLAALCLQIALRWITVTPAYAWEQGDAETVVYQTPKEGLLNYIDDPWNTTPRPDVFLFEEISEEDKAASASLYHQFLSAAPSQYLLEREEIKDLGWGETTDSDLDYVEQKALEITASCATDYERIYAVMKYLAQNICYDLDYYTYGAYPYSMLNLSAREVLENESTVCAGYAGTTATMLQLLGIPCVIADSPDHAWNIAWDGERWIMLDVTWISNSSMRYGVLNKRPGLNLDWFDFSLEEANEDENHLINGLPIPYGVVTTPTITMHPLDQRIDVSGKAVLATAAEGDVSCQWYANTVRANYGGTEIPGATAFTYEVSGLEAGSYYYYAVFSDGSNKSTTVPAEVRVYDELPAEEGQIGLNVWYYEFEDAATLHLAGSGEIDPDTMWYFHFNGSHVWIDAGITVIPEMITEGFSGIESIIVEEGNPVYTVDDSGALIDKQEQTLLYLANSKNLTEYVIPEGIVRIGNNAIDAENITSLSIPVSLETLGELQPQALADIQVDPNNTVFYLDEQGALIDSVRKAVLRLPTDSEIAAYTVADGIEIIGSYAFSDCKALRTVSFPDSVQIIEEKAFFKCSRLSGPLSLPSGLVTIGDHAFFNCGDLSGTLTIPDSVTDIGWQSFSYCWDLEKVVISGVLEDTTGNAFSSCSGLTEVILPDGMTVLPTSFFEDCSALRSLTLPMGMTKVRSDAISGLNSLTELTVPVTVTTIEEQSYADPAAVTVYGYAGSYAEAYAAEMGMQFVDLTETTGHSYTVTVVEPTCTEPGMMIYSCTHCEESCSVLDAEALGHMAVAGVYVEPGCTEAGSTGGISCSVCDTVLLAKKDIPMLGHDIWQYGLPVEPTCTEQGYQEYICGRCEYTYKDDYTEPTGHTYGRWYTVTAATCTVSGKERRMCWECEHVEEQVTEPWGHDWVDADCETPKTCAVCMATEGDALGHAYAAEVKEPTCTSGGYTTYTCQTCEDTYQDNYVGALGHTVVVDAAVAATCTESGLTEGSHCSVCELVLKEQTTVSATGHLPAIDYSVAATCTETGLTQGEHCEYCGEVFVTQEVTPALGHSWGNWMTNGAENHIRSCLRSGCNAAEEAPHQLQEIMQNGRLEQCCLTCGYVNTLILVEASGHTVTVHQNYEAHSTQVWVALYDCDGQMLELSMKDAEWITQLLFFRQVDGSMIRVFFLDENHQPVRPAIIYDLTT